MTAIVIIILVLLLWPTVWRFLRGWIVRRMQKKATDYFFRQASAAAGAAGREYTRRGQYHDGGTHGRERAYGDNEPLIPKDYAEDVEFTEIREYSSSEDVTPNKYGSVTYSREEQVEDAEIIEIKEKS